VQESSVDIDGLHLSYLDGGSGDNILMIHGFGANKDSWNRIARHLAAYARASRRLPREADLRDLVSG
jgi:pimeloyl-ACP methyl ester carboxylesterase